MAAQTDGRIPDTFRYCCSSYVLFLRRYNGTVIWQYDKCRLCSRLAWVYKVIILFSTSLGVRWMSWNERRIVWESTVAWTKRLIVFPSSFFFYIFVHALFSGGRRLLQSSELEQLQNDSYNCTSPAIKEFPSDGLTRQQRQAGFIIIHFVIVIYLFLLLAIVCDDYFVPSIKKICESEYKKIVRNIHRFLLILIWSHCGFFLSRFAVTSVRRLQFGILCHAFITFIAYIYRVSLLLVHANTHEWVNKTKSHGRAQCHRGCGWRYCNGSCEFEPGIVHQCHWHLRNGGWPGSRHYRRFRGIQHIGRTCVLRAIRERGKIPSLR